MKRSVLLFALGVMAFACTPKPEIPAYLNPDEDLEAR